MNKYDECDLVLCCDQVKFRLKCRIDHENRLIFRIKFLDFDISRPTKYSNVSVSAAAHRSNSSNGFPKKHLKIAARLFIISLETAARPRIYRPNNITIFCAESVRDYCNGFFIFILSAFWVICDARRRLSFFSPHTLDTANYTGIADLVVQLHRERFRIRRPRSFATHKFGHPNHHHRNHPCKAEVDTYFLLIT